MKTPLGTEAVIGAGHIVLDGFPAQRHSTPRLLGPCLLWPRSLVSATALLLLSNLLMAQCSIVMTLYYMCCSGTVYFPQFSAHVYCGKTAGWIKMALATEEGLNPGDFMLDGDPAIPLNVRPMFIIVIVISLEHCTGVRRYW